MAFDSSAAYSIVQTDSGQELYEQGGTYYKRFSPYDAVSPPLQYNQSVDAALTNPGNATAIAAAALAGMAKVFISAAGTSNEKSRIQAIIDAAADGTTFEFASGAFALSDNAGNGLYLLNRSNLTFLGNEAAISCALNTRFMTVTGCAGITVKGFRISGTLSTDSYLSNAEQGRIVVATSTDTRIHENTWTNAANALFVSTSAIRTEFHGNFVDRCHTGVQTSSTVYEDLSIVGNRFIGHTFNIAAVGSDDCIAIFGSAAGRTLISHNFIDKKGPTAYNQARAINISIGSGNNSEIICTENFIANVITTVAAQGRAAIDITGTDSTHAIRRLICAKNIVKNSNLAFNIDTYVGLAIVSDNVISGSTVLSGMSNSGKGIQSNVSGNLEGLRINNNTIDGTADDGMAITNLYKGSLSGNYISSAGNAGFRLDSCQDLMLSNNTVNASTGIAFLINNCTRAAVVGNISRNAGTYGFRPQGAAFSGTMVGNVASGSGTADYNDASSANTAKIATNTWN